MPDDRDVPAAYAHVESVVPVLRSFLRRRYALLHRDHEDLVQETVADLVAFLGKREGAVFRTPVVFDCAQQFQILQFFHDPSRSAGLILRRYIVARKPNEPAYGVIDDFGDPEDEADGMSVLF